jgi:hypothetical protein
MIIFCLSTFALYVVGGFIYAGDNSMVDVAWLPKLIKSLRSR